MNGARLRLVMLAAALVAVTSANASEFASKLAEDPKPEVQTDAEQLDLIRGKLASADLALRAWGAWEASERQQRDLAPNVLAALRRTLTEPEVELQEFVLRALLDAAIRLDLRLSPDELARIEGRKFAGSQVLVLASRDAAAHVDLLEQIRQERTHESRVAADNLLAECAPSRLAALLIPEVRLQVFVRVYDDEDDLPERFGARGRACGWMNVPKGLPPTVFYELARAPVEGGEVFADGPEPIAFRRDVHKLTRSSYSSPTTRFDASHHALGMLRWITGDRLKKSSLDSQIHIDHAWTNPTDYVAKVSDDIQARRAAWRTLLDALVARELLPAARIPTADPIEVEVEDLRADRSVPLPELPR